MSMALLLHTIVVYGGDGVSLLQLYCKWLRRRELLSAPDLRFPEPLERHHPPSLPSPNTPLPDLCLARPSAAATAAPPLPTRVCSVDFRLFGSSAILYPSVANSPRATKALSGKFGC